MDDETQKNLEEHFAQLPTVLQNAITSADVQQHLRTLADGRKLHLDQWQKLEDEVMLVLFAINPVTSLQQNIQSNVGISAEEAQTLTADIMRIVFEPIREQLERELGHPQAKEEQMSDVEKIRQEALSQEKTISMPAPQQTSTPIAPSGPIPATPPPAAPTEKVARAPASGAYKPGEPSTVRADVHDDPYRESPV